MSAGTAWRWRHLVARRVVQGGVLLLMAGTARWGWNVAGHPLLRGDLSASRLLDAVPLADPFAVLQMLAAGVVPGATALVGALLVLAFYALVGGRSFCSWVCPVGAVTDLAAWLRRRLGIRQRFRVPRGLRVGALVLALALSALLGGPAFEWVSPIGMVHRWVIFGAGAGAAAISALLLFDLFALRHGWCGHLCPLGAFWSQVGRVALVRVRFDAESCTRCGRCAVVCPEPHVLDLDAAGEVGFVRSGDCTNCARCIPACPEDSLWMGLRPAGATPVRGGRPLTLPPAAPPHPERTK